MKNILVPTDFSTCAENAFEMALKIAHRASARLHFLHILPADDERPHKSLPKVTPVHSAERGHAQDILNKWVAKAGRLG